MAAREQLLRRTIANSGERGYWHTQLDFLKEDAKEFPVDSFSFATLCARVGERDQAFQYLDQSFDEHSQSLLSGFSSNPPLLRSVKIPVTRTYSAAWAA